jgi:hypothetical protein
LSLVGRLIKKLEYVSVHSFRVSAESILASLFAVLFGTVLAVRAATAAAVLVPTGRICPPLLFLLVFPRPSAMPPPVFRPVAVSFSPPLFGAAAPLLAVRSSVTRVKVPQVMRCSPSVGAAVCRQVHPLRGDSRHYAKPVVLRYCSP